MKINVSKIVQADALQLVRVKWEDSLSIAAIDSRNDMCSNKEEYAKVNQLNYYVVINTWLYLISDISEQASYEIEYLIRHQGLMKVIRICSSAADDFLSGTPVSGDPSILRLVREALAQDELGATLLMALRYPKRFSPLLMEGLVDKAITDFQSVEQRNFQLDRNFSGKARSSSLPVWLREGLRHYVSIALEGYNPRLEDSRFTNGTNVGVSNHLVSKVSQYGREHEYLFDYRYPLAGGTVDRFYFNQKGEMMRYACNTIKAVPKSYKAARIIAPEPVSNVLLATSVEAAIRRCLKQMPFANEIDLNDQDHNKQLAQEGSVDGLIATIDLSHASDTVRASLVRDIFPAKVVNDMFNCRSTHTIVGGKLKLLSCFSTAGSVLTFPVESLVFWAYGRVALDLVNSLTGEKYSVCSVYGDDIIIDARCAETLIDLLSISGFVVNTEKSYFEYGTGPAFRESCGGEYYAGIDISSKYFPRKYLYDGKEYFLSHRSTPDSIATAALISLQHKLYDNWKCNTFLTTVVRSIFPKMTAHIVGSECTDLWSPIPEPSSSYEGVVQVKDCNGKYCSYYTESVQYGKYYHLSSLQANEMSDFLRIVRGSRSDYEMYRYVMFLLKGPSYLDDLSRMLRISNSRSYERDCSSTAVKFTLGWD